MYCKLSLFIIILISVIVFIILLYDTYPSHYPDKFLNVNQIDNDNYIDGKMNFNYLVNPLYTNNMLKTYYFNDDNPGVYHPNQMPYIVNSKKYYGNTGKQASLYPELIFYYDLVHKPFFDNLYNSQGIRI